MSWRQQRGRVLTGQQEAKNKELYKVLGETPTRFDVLRKTLFVVPGTDQPSFRELTDPELLAVTATSVLAETFWTQAMGSLIAPPRDAPSTLWEKGWVVALNQGRPIDTPLRSSFGAMSEEEARERKADSRRRSRLRRADAEAENPSLRVARLEAKAVENKTRRDARSKLTKEQEELERRIGPSYRGMAKARKEKKSKLRCVIQAKRTGPSHMAKLEARHDALLDERAELKVELGQYLGTNRELLSRVSY